MWTVVGFGGSVTYHDGSTVTATVRTAPGGSMVAVLICSLRTTCVDPDSTHPYSEFTVYPAPDSRTPLQRNPRDGCAVPGFAERDGINLRRRVRPGDRQVVLRARFQSGRQRLSPWPHTACSTASRNRNRCPHCHRAHSNYIKLHGDNRADDLGDLAELGRSSVSTGLVAADIVANVVLHSPRVP